MNIYEAATSGKRFKRKSWKCWAALDESTVSGDDITATDYVTEPIKKQISKEDLAIAWDKSAMSGGYVVSTGTNLFTLLCKNLELE